MITSKALADNLSLDIDIDILKEFRYIIIVLKSR